MQDRILSLDWGEKHVGVAMYQSGVGISILPAITNITYFQLVDKLHELIDKFQINVVLIGSTGRVKTKYQVHKLQNRLMLKVKVIVVDEFLSSQQATTELRGESTREKNKKIHSVSAEQILRDYLEILAVKV